MRAQKASVAAVTSAAAARAPRVPDAHLEEPHPMLNVEGRHTAVQEFADMFTVGTHLPPGLPRTMSEAYALQAQLLIDLLPDSPALTRALNDLWDSKNHAVFLAVRTERKRADG